MKIGSMRLARIECDDDALMPEIDHHILHPTDLHQGRTQFANAFIAIFAFGCDLNRFQDRVIGPFRIKRIARFRIVWSCRIQCLFYLTCEAVSAAVSRATGSRMRQTFSAKILCPAAFG